MFAEAGAPHHSPHFHAYYQNHVAIYRVDTIDLLVVVCLASSSDWWKRGRNYIRESF